MGLLGAGARCICEPLYGYINVRAYRVTIMVCMQAAIYLLFVTSRYWVPSKWYLGSNICISETALVRRVSYVTAQTASQYEFLSPRRVDMYKIRDAGVHREHGNYLTNAKGRLLCQCVG